MKEKHFTTRAGYEAHVIFVKESHYCGYVVIDKSHPAYGLNYYTFSVDIDDINKELLGHIEVIKDINNLTVHGGVTYADNSLLELVEKDKWVFGFDANHAGDATKSTRMPSPPNYTFRDADYMELECEKLADQLKAIEEKAQS